MNSKRGTVSVQPKTDIPNLTTYNILEKIGSGSFATVYKAVPKEGSKDVVAIKCYKPVSPSKAKESALTEIELLKKLKHEHIVEMKSYFWDASRICIVTEFCDGGDLSNFIKQRHTLPESVCHKFLQQLALALKYLRENNVSHMDLKPQNLLLVKKPCLKLKVADFGLSQYLSNSEYTFSKRGSPLYMAPEILLEHEYDARVDLWSVGVIMYECLFGRAPYSNKSFQELTEKIKEGRPIEIPTTPRVSAECKDLLLSLLQHDPERRITFENFFSNAFLDLEHAYTEESFDKAAKLVREAVKLDNEKKTKEAFHLYCESLRYFIPVLRNECDTIRKNFLKSYINRYINRAEKLKMEIINKENHDGKETVVEQVAESENASTSERVLVVYRKPGDTFKELRFRGRTTPGLVDALEIGEVAEQYLAEGNYALALEKFKSSLSVLVPLLTKEPYGRRRDLLHKQVQFWMETAENTKGLLATKDTESVEPNYEQCVIQ